MTTHHRVTIEWTVAAVLDLEEALAFVEADDPAAAARVEQRILDAVAGLVTHPMRGRVVPELMRIGMRAYRDVTVAPYRVIYRAAHDTVYVMAVLHGARDIEAVLLRRLTRPSDE